MKNKENASVLNDLIQINNDRIEGYNRAIEELKDSESEMRSVFMNMERESKEYKAALLEKVKQLGEEPANDKTALGQIYHVWMDMKATFTGKDLKSIVAACEFGEDAAQTAYAKALASDDLNEDVRQLITSQKTALKQSHDTIKRYRDSMA